ncbi:cathepsin B-like [Tetranychus urticae]|uniref:Peptidase C1A papain C-terminal domain-containing protein n=1 Tax=Tetranychus urticae TaxID=32264 RepID=T1K0J6_TETUR|nr:cathepsin B-like [Tetranychus urticae]
MKSLIFLVLSVSLAYGARVFTQRNVHPLSDEMIDRINSIGTTWKAGRNFDEASLPYVKRLLGFKGSSLRKLQQVHHEINEELPESFDAREAWSNCTQIRTIRDQGNCGGCWAFSTVETMSDRICIASHGELQVSLSTQEMVTCGEPGGCEGGYLETSYDYYQTDGIVTGGLYHEGGCLPYTLPPCNHSVNEVLPICPKTYLPAPPCSRKCVAGYEKTFAEDKHYGQAPYTISSDPKQIMKEIMTNGPVTTGFTVYADFPSYKSGVYQKTTDDVLGGHAVKIIGWGTENGVDYWLVANSWNEYWGDKGFFKIRRGNDECGFEDNVITGLPKLS